MLRSNLEIADRLQKLHRRAAEREATWEGGELSRGRIYKSLPTELTHARDRGLRVRFRCVAEVEDRLGAGGDDRSPL